jgi:hypothetical protein
MEYFEDLQMILEQGKGSKVNKAAAIFQLIQQAPITSRSNLLRAACETWDAARSSDEVPIPMVISEEEQKELKGQWGKLTDSLLEGVLQRNPKEDEFYMTLWNVLSSPVFPDDRIRYFAFYWMLIDVRIPYFHLEEGVSMNDDRFGSISRRLGMQKAKVRFILKHNFSQKTQRASLLLEELDAVTEEERIVLMAYLLDVATPEQDKLLRGLSGLLGQDRE